MDVNAHIYGLTSRVATLEKSRGRLRFMLTLVYIILLLQLGSLALLAHYAHGKYQEYEQIVKVVKKLPIGSTGIRKPAPKLWFEFW